MKRPLAAPSGIRRALGSALILILLSLAVVVTRSADAIQVNLVANGGFESGDFAPWTVGGRMSTPVITREFVSEGVFSARLGNPVEAVEHPAGASWISQTIHVPRNLRAPELIFHYRIITNDIIHWASFRTEIHDADGERLEVLLRDGYNPPNNAAIPGYDMGWQAKRFDLSAYRGETIQIYFESRNEHDGGWGIWTYIDDVRVIDRSQVFAPLIMRNHLGYVPTATPSPTLTSTVTPTPTATATATLTLTPTTTDTPTPLDTPTPTPTPGWFVWPSPSTQDIADVALASDGTGWAVGASGLILYFDGRAWIPWPGTSPTSENLTAVHVSSRVEAWAVTDAGSILRFDGMDWHFVGRLTPEGQALWDIHLTPNSEAGWAVGEAGTIVWFDGVSWFLLPERLVPTTQTLRAVHAVSDEMAWSVGDNGTILYYLNGQWTNWSNAMSHIQTSATLRDVQLYGEDGWIVGDVGTMMKYINDAWYILTPRPVDADLYALKLLTADHGWAVGELGALFSYNGSSWTQVNSPASATLMGIDLLASETGWSVGANGAILRRGFGFEIPTPTSTRRPSTPTWTLTPTTTTTATSTPTFTSTPSLTPSPTATPISTFTPTPSHTASPASTATRTITQTSTRTPSPTSTFTVTMAPTRTWTPTLASP